MPSKWFVPDSYLAHERGAVIAREKLSKTYAQIHIYTDAEHAEAERMKAELAELKAMQSKWQALYQAAQKYPLEFKSLALIETLNALDSGTYSGSLAKEGS